MNSNNQDGTKVPDNQQDRLTPAPMNSALGVLLARILQDLGIDGPRWTNLIYDYVRRAAAASASNNKLDKTDFLSMRGNLSRTLSSPARAVPMTYRRLCLAVQILRWKRMDIIIVGYDSKNRASRHGVSIGIGGDNEFLEFLEQSELAVNTNEELCSVADQERSATPDGKEGDSQ